MRLYIMAVQDSPTSACAKMPKFPLSVTASKQLIAKNVFITIDLIHLEGERRRKSISNYCLCRLCPKGGEFKSLHRVDHYEIHVSCRKYLAKIKERVRTTFNT